MNRHVGGGDISIVGGMYLWARPLGRYRSSAGGDTPPPAPPRVASRAFFLAKSQENPDSWFSFETTTFPHLPAPSRILPHPPAPSCIFPHPPAPSPTLPHPPSPSLHPPSPSPTVAHRPAPSPTVPHRPPPSRTVPAVPHPAAPSRTVPHRPAPSPTVPHHPARLREVAAPHGQSLYLKGLLPRNTPKLAVPPAAQSPGEGDFAPCQQPSWNPLQGAPPWEGSEVETYLLLVECMCLPVLRPLAGAPDSV